VNTDWLLSRRHCPQNWQQLVLAVREKINVAIQDMPAVEDVAKLLQGACELSAVLAESLYIILI